MKHLKYLYEDLHHMYFEKWYERNERKLINKNMHKLNWFTSRIWKRIYRDKWTCKCDTCKNVEENGLIIYNKSHAYYLHMCQEIHNYRDNP